MQVAIPLAGVLRTVHDFLLEHKLVGAARALELEAGIAYIAMDDVAFLRQLVLDGRWGDVELICTPLASAKGFAFDAIMYEIRKQQFLEILAARAESDDEDGVSTATQAVAALRSLEGLCPSRVAFNSLCYALTLSSVNEHPDFADWSPLLGRHRCFDAIRVDFERVLPPPLSGPLAARTATPGALERIFAQAGAAQAMYRAVADNRLLPVLSGETGLSILPFDPARGVDIPTTGSAVPSAGNSSGSGRVHAAGRGSAPSAVAIAATIADVVTRLSTATPVVEPLTYTLPVRTGKGGGGDALNATVAGVSNSSNHAGAGLRGSLGHFYSGAGRSKGAARPATSHGAVGGGGVVPPARAIASREPEYRARPSVAWTVGMDPMDGKEADGAVDDLLSASLSGMGRGMRKADVEELRSMVRRSMQAVDTGAVRQPVTPPRSTRSSATGPSPPRPAPASRGHDSAPSSPVRPTKRPSVAWEVPAFGGTPTPPVSAEGGVLTETLGAYRRKAEAPPARLTDGGRRGVQSGPGSVVPPPTMPMQVSELWREEAHGRSRWNAVPPARGAVRSSLVDEGYESGVFEIDSAGVGHAEAANSHAAPAAPVLSPVSKWVAERPLRQSQGSARPAVAAPASPSRTVPSIRSSWQGSAPPELREAAAGTEHGFAAAAAAAAAVESIPTRPGMSHSRPSPPRPMLVARGGAEAAAAAARPSPFGPALTEPGHAGRIPRASHPGSYVPTVAEVGSEEAAEAEAEAEAAVQRAAAGRGETRPAPVSELEREASVTAKWHRMVAGIVARAEGRGVVVEALPAPSGHPLLAKGADMSKDRLRVSALEASAVPEARQPLAESVMPATQAAAPQPVRPVAVRPASAASSVSLPTPVAHAPVPAPAPAPVPAPAPARAFAPASSALSASTTGRTSSTASSGGLPPWLASSLAAQGCTVVQGASAGIGFLSFPPTLTLTPTAVFKDTEPVRAVAWSPASLVSQLGSGGTGLLAVGTNSRALNLCSPPSGTSIDSETGLPLMSVEHVWHGHHEGSIYAIAWGGTPGNELLATGSNDVTLRVARFARDTEGCVPDSSASTASLVLPSECGTIRDLCWLGGGGHGPPSLAAAGGGDHAVRVWDIAAYATMPFDSVCGPNPVTVRAPRNPPTTLSGHKGVVHGLRAWDESGRTLVSASADGSVRLWDLRASSRGGAAATLCLTTPGGELALPGTALPTVLSPSAIELHALAVPSSGGGRELVVGTANGWLAVIDLHAGRLLASAAVHKAEVRSVDAAGPLLLSSSFDGTLALSAAVMGGSGHGQQGVSGLTVLASRSDHVDKTLCARWHPSAAAFASSSADKTALLWSVS